MEGTCFRSHENAFMEKDNVIIKIINKKKSDFNIWASTSKEKEALEITKYMPHIISVLTDKDHYRLTEKIWS